MPFRTCKRLPECSRCGNIWVPEDHSLLDATERVMAERIHRCGRCKTTAWNSPTDKRVAKPKATKKSPAKKAAKKSSREGGRPTRRKTKDLDEAGSIPALHDELIDSLIPNHGGGEPTSTAEKTGTGETAVPVPQSRATMVPCRHRLMLCPLCKPHLKEATNAA